jgi:hypothetical protein
MGQIRIKIKNRNRDFTGRRILNEIAAEYEIHPNQIDNV